MTSIPTQLGAKIPSGFPTIRLLSGEKTSYKIREKCAVSLNYCCVVKCSNLSSHNPLSLFDEAALGALAVAVLAGLLVPPQTRDVPVVATPRALRDPRPCAVHFSGPAGDYLLSSFSLETS